MADPKSALASIGKFTEKRQGAPNLLKAIQRDVIKVNFDPSKTSVRLVRHLAVDPAKASAKIVHAPKTISKHMKALKTEQGESSHSLQSPSRYRSLINPHKPPSSSHFGLASNRRSSLALVNQRLEEMSNLNLNRASSSGVLPGRPSKPWEEKATAAPPHGFRYRSNGDERYQIPRSASVSRTESSSDTAFHKAADLSYNYQHLKHMRSQVVGHLSRAHGEKKMKEAFRLAGICDRRSKPSQSRIATSPQADNRDERELCWETRIIKDGGTMFKQTILRHIRDMAQSSNMRLGCNVCSSSSESTNGNKGTKSLRLRSGSGACAEVEDSRGDCLSANNSSFNMRYGVPVKLMAERVPILDEQHSKHVCAA